MKIDRDATIGDAPVRLVRTLMQRRLCDLLLEDIEAAMRRDWWEAVVEDLFKRGLFDSDSRVYARKSWNWDAAQICGQRVPKRPDFAKQARTLLDALVAEGYVIPAKEGQFKITMKGAALSMTAFVPRMKRAKADALLKGVLDRVAAINADPAMLHWVTEVRVFGSYLKDTDDLGDLDLAFSYRRRPAKVDDMNGVDNIDRSYRTVRQRIRNRSPRISMHSIDELDRTPELGGRTIYNFTPAEAA
jgi:hypothetical protein